jgi:glycosyltransferase involved in cell wall biosynthesis
VPQDNPLVSVVIPVRNGERLIGRTLKSVVAQTYREIEIIVVDDGSTDQTGEVVEASAPKCRPLRLFRRPHSGLPATRNFGINKSNGEFIAPLDSDDLWHPEKIARQVEAIKASPKIGLVYCWTVDIDENDFVIPPVREKNVVEGNALAEVVAKAGVVECASTPLIRRSCLDAIGGYDSDQRLGAEDWKLYLALAEICDFAVVRAHLVGYRRSHGSMSRNVAAMAQAMESVSGWIMDRWHDMPSDVRQQMIYHINGYLAHQALTNNQFAEALRYQVKGYVARPAALLEPSSLTFAARVIARATGAGRAIRLFRSKPVHFDDFRD